MTRKLIFFLLLSFLAIATEKREGIASDLKRGTFLYKELHLIEKDSTGFNKKITTTYKDENDKVFAKMTSDFSKHRMIPDTTFEDLRFNSKYEQTINLKDLSLEIIHTENDTQKKNKKIKVYENTIAGQGFDNFIKEEFNNLKKKKIKFVVLDQLDFFNFMASSLSHKILTESQFKLEIDSFWVGLLINPITVTYSNDSKKLIKYQGLSNILDKNKKSQEVLISYDDFNQK